MNFRGFIDESELASLLSPKYLRFAAAVKEGLVSFLSGLPESIQISIMQKQFRLGLKATFSERLGTLAQCSPVLHKLGQTLARNQQLAPSLRFELQKLEWLQPTFSPLEIEAELNREIGSLKAHNIILAPEPLAEASVAIVIPFAKNDSCQSGKPVVFNSVFKVLKPGIEKRLRLEFELLHMAGTVLDERCLDLDIPTLEYRKIFTQVTETLKNEVLLEQEQQNLLEASVCYKNHPLIKIPKLLQPCSSRVTAMERIMGRKLEAASIHSVNLQRQMADLVVSALVVQPMFSSAKRALFHGDPHAGNLFLTDDGRLALLDWSQVGHLDLPQRRLISQIMLAAITLRSEKISALIGKLAQGTVPDGAGLRQVVEKSLRSIRPGHPPGFSWLVRLLDTTVQEAQIQFPRNILFFRKALITVAGLVEELSGVQERADTVVLQDFMHIFAEEWPWRWQFISPCSEWTSHLSNVDLLDATMSALVYPPQSFAEYWLRLLAYQNKL